MTNHSCATPQSEHATTVNFCQIFDRDMNALYSLALLLAGDPAIAEECFVSGLDLCLSATSVFKEWARAWSKRAIIKNAIRLVAPSPEAETKTNHAAKRTTASMEGKGLDAVMQLSPFDRFVFVMSVLERYSDQECGILLNCTAREVAAARCRALRRLSFGSAAAPAAILTARHEERIAADKQAVCA